MVKVKETTTIIKTTSTIRTTIPTTTPTTAERLTGVVQPETISDCEALGCPSGTMFVGSKSSNKYHYCDCVWAKKIKPSNLVCFKSVEEAENMGYVPCKVCKP
ncbi:MAG: Ada metal-binding domain-containing protein [Candidatus Aenigmarchaeota archaeon]|nr:Ada metal-binding domain-containing protein [Candidatus Aenigmarchaeota archaeon]